MCLSLPENQGHEQAQLLAKCLMQGFVDNGGHVPLLFKGLFAQLLVNALVNVNVNFRVGLVPVGGEK